MLASIGRLFDESKPVTMEALVDELEREAPRGNGSCGPANVAELADEIVLELRIADTARRIHRHALERERTHLYGRAAPDSDTPA